MIAYTSQPDFPAIRSAPKNCSTAGISNIPSDRTINTIQMINTLNAFCHCSRVTLFHNFLIILSSLFIALSPSKTHLFSTKWYWVSICLKIEIKVHRSHLNEF